MTEIIVALIVGGLGLLGTIISNKSTENKVQQQIMVSQAVTDTKLEELTREVREHNNFAKRMPVVENEIQHIEQDMIADIKDELKELKKYHTN